jgi:hypothetical protein
MTGEIGQVRGRPQAPAGTRRGVSIAAICLLLLLIAFIQVSAPQASLHIL